MLHIAGGILIAFVVLFCLPQVLATILIFLAIIIVGFILLSLHNSGELPIVILTCLVIFCLWIIFECFRNKDTATRIKNLLKLVSTSLLHFALCLIVAFLFFAFIEYVILGFMWMFPP